jgi:hypothetical protein
VLRWCLYSSLVIRDLTLRSAVSFGSFHLTRLFLDELVAWLVERLAEQGGSAPFPWLEPRVCPRLDAISHHPSPLCRFFLGPVCLEPSYLKASPLVVGVHHGGSCVAPNPEVSLEHF